MAGIPAKIQTWQMTHPTSRDRETKEVTSGKINIDAFVQTRPMRFIMESFEEAHKIPRTGALY